MVKDDGRHLSPSFISRWKTVKDAAYHLSPANTLTYNEFSLMVKDWRINVRNWKIEKSTASLFISVCFAICGFSPYERPCFARQYAAFCSAKHGILQRRLSSSLRFVCFCVSFISAFCLFLRFVCFCVSFASAFRQFLCFGVICNPPKYTIRICNPLKPLRLAVCKQGAVNRIANPYNKNRRIANPPERSAAKLRKYVLPINKSIFLNS